ncbi:MAG: prepilin-type N-terminal cleavage/methylation domain-containing protein [Nitrospirae bacterium]|nr:prepilin-type N-terminal cleavage/methylation domain-containing protein [Nitrospirota bacterium]
MKQTIHGRHGFTLMETLIAMGVFSLVAVIMAVTIKLCLKSVEKGDKKVASIERLSGAVRIMGSQLQSLVPMMYNDNDSLKKLFCFKGCSDEFAFVSNVSAWGRDRGVVAVRYDLNNGGDLVVTEWDMLNENQRSTVLLKNIKKISFKYIIKRPEDMESKPEANVEKTETIPDYVQISSPAFENDIIIPIMARNTMQTSISKVYLFDSSIFR